MTITGKMWLCMSPVLLAVLDYGLTLYGQPAAYWAGDYSRVNEANPVSRWCLERHPALFVLEFFPWAGLFCVFIIVLPSTLAKMLSLGVALGHIVGAASWMWRHFGQYWLFPITLMSSAVLIVWTFERADSSAPGTSIATEPTKL
ncbi:MAG: hypothetical protein FJ303_13240 [Planctomycetes bacterium]|nr:hypothetical protein [Planctomycetota bacterium]